MLVCTQDMSRRFLENTLHIVNSPFTNLFIVYIFPFCWLLYQCKQHQVPLSLFINKKESYNFLHVLLITGMLSSFSYGYLVLHMYSFAWITPSFIMDILNQPIVSHTGGYLYQFIVMVLIAPVIGEFLFRGFLFHRFAVKWGTGKAILAVAFLFGCLHIDFIAAPVFSIVLSIVYIRTKSLLMPISIHMLSNGIVLTVTFILSKGQTMSFADFLHYTPFWTGLIIFIIGLNLVLVFLYIHRRYMNKEVFVPYANEARNIY